MKNNCSVCCSNTNYLILVNYKTWSQYISFCQCQCACQCDYNNVSVFPVLTHQSQHGHILAIQA